MRNTREILRLKYEAGLSHRMIARAVGVANSTVSDVSARMKAAGLVWQDAATLSDVELQRRLYRDHQKRAADPREPDWNRVRAELAGNKHVTLQLLWAEYREEEPDGYGYSWYCERYRAWQGGLDLVMRQEHRYGERLFVDWAGDTMSVVTPGTGEIRQAYLFVAVFGASNYLYAEASLSCGTHVFLSAHCRAFSYFGGVPELVVCDNLKTGVRKPDRYEPDLHAPYAELAAHYGCAVFPARVRKPRDKAKVENGVLIAQRRILAALRNRTFFSLLELNAAIAVELEKLNSRPMQGVGKSRNQLFEELDKPALKALPAQRFELREWKKAKVHIDYHVAVQGAWYSVPYTLIGKEVQVCLTATAVAILFEGKRVASHARTSRKNVYVTVDAHRPHSHQKHLEWTPERMRRWGQSIGAQTGTMIETIIEQADHPDHAYRKCLGLLRLAKSRGNDRLELACAQALKLQAVGYRSVKNLLDKGLEAVELPESEPGTIPLIHDNVRGSDYYAGGAR